MVLGLHITIFSRISNREVNNLVLNQTTQTTQDSLPDFTKFFVTPYKPSEPRHLLKIDYIFFLKL